MRLLLADLVKREVEGWPETIILEDVPLGKTYLVDQDSLDFAVLYNGQHPEWGMRHVPAVLDVLDGFPLPVECLRFRDCETGEEIKVTVKAKE